MIECRIPRYSVKLGFVKSLAVDPSHEIREAIGNPLLDRQIVGESQVGLVSVRSMLVRHALDESNKCLCIIPSEYPQCSSFLSSLKLLTVEVVPDRSDVRYPAEIEHLNSRITLEISG